MKRIWAVGIIATIILGAILYLAFVSKVWGGDMGANLASELAGICLGTILALVVYYQIDQDRAKAHQDGIRQLIQQSIADHLHNFLIAVALRFPISNSGRVLAAILPQGTKASQEVADAIHDLIEQIESLPSIVDGVFLEDTTVNCYKQEKDGLLVVSEVVGQQVAQLSSRPNFVRQFFEFDNARRALDRAVKLAQSDNDFGLYAPRIRPAFESLLRETSDLYSALLKG